MSLQYGFELEYCGNILLSKSQLPVGIDKTYWDGSYEECGEICSDVFDTLLDAMIAFHSGVTALLDRKAINHLLYKGTADSHECTGLHISINDPTLGARHRLWNKMYWNPVIDLDGTTEYHKVFNRRWPYLEEFIIKKPRFESKFGCSTVNPYAVIKYINWTVMNYAHILGRLTDPQASKKFVLATINDVPAMVENILTLSGTSEDPEEILRVCDDLAERTVVQDANHIRKVGITSLDAQIHINTEEEAYCSAA